MTQESVADVSARLGASGDLPEFAWRRVAGVAAAAVAVLLAVATRYGYHRDELYFVEASRHLGLGYVDQPPFAPAMAGLARLLFGDSLLGLRLFPALADGLLVMLAGLIAREFGGGRFAQVFAAACTAVAPVFLISAHLAGPTAYDQVAWGTVALLVVRILRTGNARLWPAVGLVIGVGLQDKETILLFVGALAVGFVLNGQLSLIRSRWLWLGVLIAVLVWAPVFVWQARHGWAVLEMDANLRREHSGADHAVGFPILALLMPGAFAAPVWVAGLWALWRETGWRRYRAFAIAHAAMFLVLLVLISDRAYYQAPIYLVLLGAGGVVVEQVVAGRRRLLARRLPGRGLIWRSPASALSFVVVPGVLLLWLSLPILPVRVLASVPIQNLNYDMGETVGWPELVAQVAGVRDQLPDAERAGAVVLTSNYGEAGAIDRYGSAFGLPTAYSGHNTYWWWGPPVAHGAPNAVTIAVGFDRSELTPYFGDVRLAATVHNDAGVANDEEGASIWVCSGQHEPWSVIWPQFRHYG